MILKVWLRFDLKSVHQKKKNDFVAEFVGVMSSGILFAFVGYLERQQVTPTVILDRFCAGSEIHQPEAIGICEIPLQRSQGVEKKESKY